MQEKNALTKLAQGPMHAFKGCEVSLVLEELLGRLGVLRRNQIIRYVGDVKLDLALKLVERYGMHTTTEEYTNVALAIVDSKEPLELWKTAQLNAMVTAVRFEVRTIDNYNACVVMGNELGCVPVIVSDEMLVFVRRDLANDAGIKGINLRNFEIVFYDA